MPGFEWIDEKEAQAVSKIFKEGGTLFAHGFDNIRKKYYVRSFEKNCEKYFGSAGCLAVSSGTAAIKIALKAVGVKKGDEVITQSFNFIATVEAILDCGAIPIIANINDTLNLDSEELPKLISKKTKAIIPVHMLGVPCEMDKIKSIAKKYKIPVVEDNCEAVGAKYKGKFLGTLGDIGIFSFDHGKILTSGEGGMILTNKNKLLKYCKEYHDHGHENNKNLPRGRDTKKIFGFNYRMTEIQGTIVNEQLKKLSKIIKDNSSKFNVLKNIVSPHFKTRLIPKGSMCINDTLIIFQSNKVKKKEIIKILKKYKFGTKNLPDAMEWHCSFFWEHALKKSQIIRSKKTLKILQDCIAIPIWKRKTIKDYQKLGNKIIEYK